MTCSEEAEFYKGLRVNINVLKLAYHINQIYEYSCNGSNLHVFIDDDNFEDHHVQNCFKTVSDNIFNSTPQQQDHELKTLRIAITMTERERYAALLIHNLGLLPIVENETELVLWYYSEGTNNVKELEDALNGNQKTRT